MSTEHVQVGDQVGNQADEEQAPAIDPQKLKRYMDRIRDDQNLMMGILGGLAGAGIGAVLWAVITVLTQYQIGYMALGVGFLAGLGVKFLGRGIDPAFQFAGAALALAGCLAGNFMVMIAFGTMETGLPVSTILSVLTPSLLVELYADAFSVIDLLFYGLAVSIGYKTALTTIPKADLQKLV